MEQQHIANYVNHNKCGDTYACKLPSDLGSLYLEYKNKKKMKI